jgi:hypothetical protein
VNDGFQRVSDLSRIGHFCAFWMALAAQQTAILSIPEPGMRMSFAACFSTVVALLLTLLVPMNRRTLAFRV